MTGKVFTSSIRGGGAGVNQWWHLTSSIREAKQGFISGGLFTSSIR